MGYGKAGIKYTTITIATEYETSGSLGGKSVTATSEPGTPDYSWTNSQLTAPVETINGVQQASSRLVVKNVGVRLLVDVTRTGGATKLYFKVKKGATTIIDGSGSGAYGADGTAQPTIGNLAVTSSADIRGQALTVDFWTDQGSVTIANVTLQIAYGVGGNAGGSGNHIPVFQLSNMYGLATLGGACYVYGSGTFGVSAGVSNVSQQLNFGMQRRTTGQANGTLLGTVSALSPFIINSLNNGIAMLASTATDLVAIHGFNFNIMEF